MIITLTANPSTDRTVSLAGELERGAVQRVVAATSQAGGKGVNISRAAVAAEIPTMAVLPAPADDGFLEELTAAGIPWDAVPCDGPPRVNLTITEPDGTTTKLNAPGPVVDDGVLAALADRVHAHLAPGAWVVLAGSLPPGAPFRWYAEVVAGLVDSGTRVAVDTSDEPLRALVGELPGSAPGLLKPNAEELAAVTDGDPDTLERDPVVAAAAARRLLDRGVGTVLATLGSRGAVLATADGIWHASAPPVAVVSTVGAGDCSLFGYLLGDLRGLDPASRLALAVAYGSAAAGLPGTSIPHPSNVRTELVRVRELQPTQGT